MLKLHTDIILIWTFPRRDLHCNEKKVGDSRIVFIIVHFKSSSWFAISLAPIAEKYIGETERTEKMGK